MFCLAAFLNLYKNIWVDRSFRTVYTENLQQFTTQNVQIQDQFP